MIRNARPPIPTGNPIKSPRFVLLICGFAEKFGALGTVEVVITGADDGEVELVSEEHEEVPSIINSKPFAQVLVVVGVLQVGVPDTVTIVPEHIVGVALQDQVPLVRTFTPVLQGPGVGLQETVLL